MYRVPELITLEFSIRYLQMPVLEKKLAGATLLISKVLSVNKSPSTLKGSVLKKWLTEETLIEWLREKKIFSVFSPFSHCIGFYETKNH